MADVTHGTGEVTGNVAHDAVDAGNPLKIGGTAVAATPAAVADGDRVNAWFTTKGELAIVLHDSTGNRTDNKPVNLDAEPTGVRGLSTQSFLYGYNGSTWDRLRSTITGGLEVGGSVAHDAADAGDPIKIGGYASATQRTVAAADRTDGAWDRHGALHVRTGGHAASTWDAHHRPAANTQATIVQAAGGAGVRNVCTSITAMLVAGTTAPSAAQVYVELLDGATVKWEAYLSLPAIAGASNGIALSNIEIPGTANTTMTLRFSAAAGANTLESVAMTGKTITE